MKIDPRPYRVLPDKKFRLSKRPTSIEALCQSDEEYVQRLRQQIEAMRPLHERLYADNRFALLLIFQAMDAAGKDGTIKHVLSGLNPQGCQVYSFQHPSARELDHDFLWRTTRFLPERGRIGIFNRSYYEEVLIVRVQPEILEAQRIPGVGPDSKNVWRDRYRSILDHEAHLHRNGTRIVKFFLHISPEEQRKRFLKRIENPRKNWKFAAADLEARDRWGDYQKAYEQCLSATSTDHAPWYVIPADCKPDARLLVSQIVLETLAGLDMKRPEMDERQKKILQKARKKLLAEK
jgi:PPK2 family polyphosphate:nucleotide phosphotransferase